MGDAVNIASRMESFAAAGAVFISGKGNDEIENQKNIETVLMGKFELKNVSVPMEIFAVSNDNLVVPKKQSLHGKGIQFSKRKSFPKKLFISFSFVLFLAISAFFFHKKYWAKGMGDPQPKTIGVIPFVNLSALKDDEYFSDGICNEIQTQLSKIDALKVSSDFYFNSQYAEALRHLEKSRALDPNYPFAAYFTGMCYAAQEKFSEAVKQEQLAHTIIASPWSHGRLADDYARAGNFQMAKAILDSLKKESDTVYVASGVVAGVYVALGDKEQAFEYLGKAVNERAGWLVYLNVDPIWYPIRSDAGFRAILKQIVL